MIRHNFEDAEKRMRGKIGRRQAWTQVDFDPRGKSLRPRLTASRSTSKSEDKRRSILSRFKSDGPVEKPNNSANRHSQSNPTVSRKGK